MISECGGGGTMGGWTDMVIPLELSRGEVTIMHSIMVGTVITEITLVLDKD